MQCMEEEILAAAKLYDPNLSLKKEQLESLIHVMNNKDVIVNLPTGFGKSIIFHLLPSHWLVNSIFYNLL